ncbi:MAG: PilZ domain-containing protein [Candidatus Omnitrophica bacterium]|nr:PilZ domain-containing protein [Candidatus Omnitrophota bacterium]
MQEKRAHTRTNISFPVECSFLPQRNYFYTVTRDLGRGGLQIITNKFIAKDNIIKVNINLIDKIITTKAKVAWCNKTRASERYCAGLRFVEMSKPSQKQIGNFLDKLTPV